MSLRCQVLKQRIQCIFFGTLIALLPGPSASIEEPSASTKEAGQQYYVYNAKCQIPFVNPFTLDVMKNMKEHVFEECSEERDLIESKFDFDLRQYRVSIPANLSEAYLNSTGHQTITCSYQEIKRDMEAEVPDNAYAESKAYYLPHRMIVPIDTDFMITKCYMRNATTVLNEVQEDAFSFVQDKLPPQKIEHYMLEREQKPSVLIMGLDSVSRINFRRTMPKMFEFVNEEGWYEMQGYNKVGDNTFPNILAALTGHSEAGSRAICNVSEVNCLDRLPFIWRNYKQANYLTAYGEDCVELNALQYLKPGFLKQPTDYYLRHFIVALEDKFKLRHRFGNVYCVGRHLSFNYVFDFGLQFVERFVNETPIFGLLWSNSFTHDDFAAPAALDEHFLDYMERFEAAGLFENSIVVLMSDHGHRYDEIVRHGPNGFLEERLPMMFIYVPPWFRQKYPHLVKNLGKNRDRLSSNFDLYMTLRHLLQLDSQSMADIEPKAPQCASCQSLLFELPFNRSCQEAGIDEHWCSCHPTQDATNESFARPIALAVVQYMNDHLRKQHLTDLCHDYTLKHLDSLQLKMPVDANDEPRNANESYFVVNFKTNPNSAHFETTVLYKSITGGVEMNMDFISRLNSHAKDSGCVALEIPRKYCICKNSVRMEDQLHA
ncbi:uncharacterized protein LOC115626587 [Scaptodrosophila lebanonensis]|uniref:Uncharacterized protein LOC115626587 n=1 Tax=Drosophila lebanonensis TaxID=7225 RepID=A0A6J2TP60_DROLE|nr:uncharacterized protein LOC115626587 [Scaptodrosophila lebanonensis]